jgi:hypothetical protein
VALLREPVPPLRTPPPACHALRPVSPGSLYKARGTGATRASAQFKQLHESTISLPVAMVGESAVAVAAVAAAAMAPTMMGEPAVAVPVVAAATMAAAMLVAMVAVPASEGKSEFVGGVAAGACPAPPNSAVCLPPRCVLPLPGASPGLCTWPGARGPPGHQRDLNRARARGAPVWMGTPLGLGPEALLGL